MRLCVEGMRSMGGGEWKGKVKVGCVGTQYLQV